MHIVVSCVKVAHIPVSIQDLSLFSCKRFFFIDINDATVEISAKMGNTIRPVPNDETVVKYFVAVLELKMFPTMFKPRGARYSTQGNAVLCIFTLVALQH